MKLASLEAIVAALNAGAVRYLIAGGLAVNAHGYIRTTQDVDMVIALDAANIARAFEALATLGYRPLVPIAAAQFADADTRLGWIREKGMQVLNFFSDRHRETNVDLFVSEPFEFAREHANALRGDLAPGVEVRFVSFQTLIAMKRQAGRPRDLDDIQHLGWIAEERKTDE
ncbi:MAG: nucleotidyl transferase AbiEii/AbiGii toxin family protein [Betaproteobacteria bacterium]